MSKSVAVLPFHKNQKQKRKQQILRISFLFFSRYTVQQSMYSIFCSYICSLLSITSLFSLPTYVVRFDIEVSTEGCSRPRFPRVYGYSKRGGVSQAQQTPSLSGIGRRRGVRCGGQKKKLGDIVSHGTASRNY